MDHHIQVGLSMLDEFTQAQIFCLYYTRVVMLELQQSTMLTPDIEMSNQIHDPTDMQFRKFRFDPTYQFDEDDPQLEFVYPDD